MNATAPALVKPPRRALAARVPVVGDLIAAVRLLRDREAPGLAKAVVVAALVYLVVPVDLLPEALLPLVGWLDDLGVLVATRLLLGERLERYRYPLFEERPAPKP